MSEAVAIGARDDESRRATPAIQLVRLRKTYGDVVAVDDIDLEILEGEFFSLLGPSGSGKTTVLRMIAGFELPTGGAVLLQGSDVSHLKRFADALLAARPELAPEEVYWRLHFVLGMIHQNRFMELDRLHVLSGGLTREGEVDALLERMLDFAEAGFLR